MNICVIFNPAARGDKARKLRKSLELISRDCVLKPTTAAGMARTLASQAVREGFETIVAAGGDGTLNEVLNGMGDAPDGFARARLGVLPLGTINVFAREIGLPKNITAAWQVVLRGREIRIDLPEVEFMSGGKKERRYFAQLAGAGTDAAAVKNVSWELKKKYGQWAYIVAGLKTLRQKQTLISVVADGETAAGEQVALGNGRFYAGHFKVFPRADLRNGRLEACIFPRVHIGTILRYTLGLVTNRFFGPDGARYISAANFRLTSETETALQLDGEYVGELPASFSIIENGLRIVIP